MRVRWTLISLVAASSVSLLPATAATAQPTYPPTAPTLTVSAGAVTVGDAVTIQGSNFGSNDQISIDVSYQDTTGARFGSGSSGAIVPVALPLPIGVVKTVRADADGNFQTSVVLTRVGRAVITATGSPSGVSASATVRVYAKGEALPTTGDDGGIVTRLQIGAGAVAAGVVLVFGAMLLRRRSRANADT
ncbi:hypothetical protein [Micromonospora sp. CPCC 206061]|uniref:hypothetical protein n=1 Tax=Micromonospora sp. CPCC 206061 TaxID=3122410 RepID=UPI002FEFD904